MNLKKMMKQAQELQEKMARDMAALEVDAEVGGGMVKVKMSGNKQLLGLTIDPEVLDPEDPAMAQDLILSAVNEASRRVDEALQQQVASIPGMPGLGV